MAKAKSTTKAPKEAKAPKVRAHEEDGTFTADDPATPDVNEAFVEAAPAARSYHPKTVTEPLNPGIQKKLALEARSKK
tara:strand:+ start:1245 stop:1478 length:234 start_codon:yes stop_codon:yes gene_type:complete